MPVLGHLDAVDQPQIIDVHRNLGIVDLLQRVDDRIIHRATGLDGRIHLRLLRQEPGEIIPLALRVGVRLHHDARLGRRGDGLHFLDLEPIAHLKILVTRSIPRTSAATSAGPLYTPKLARAVASTPSASISGCAQ